jgi:hypothetical protein
MFRRIGDGDPRLVNAEWRRQEIEELREDLALLRTMIDRALDQDADTRILRATTSVFIDYKERLAELELQERFAPCERQLRVSE